MTESVRSTEPHIFTIRPFTEKVRQPLLRDVTSGVPARDVGVQILTPSLDHAAPQGATGTPPVMGHKLSAHCSQAGDSNKQDRSVILAHMQFCDIKNK